MGSFWKFTALAGVVGIGSLAVLQAQRGFSEGKEGQLAASSTETPNKNGGPTPGPITQTSATGFPAENGFAQFASETSPPPQQYEPQSADTFGFAGPGTPADTARASTAPPTEPSFAEFTDVPRAAQPKTEQVAFRDAPGPVDPFSLDTPPAPAPSDNPFENNPVPKAPVPSKAPFDFKDDPFAPQPKSPPSRDEKVGTPPAAPKPIGEAFTPTQLAAPTESQRKQPAFDPYEPESPTISAPAPSPARDTSNSGPTLVPPGPAPRTAFGNDNTGSGASFTEDSETGRASVTSSETTVSEPTRRQGDPVFDSIPFAPAPAPEPTESAPLGFPNTNREPAPSTQTPPEFGRTDVANNNNNNIALPLPEPSRDDPPVPLPIISPRTQAPERFEPAPAAAPLAPASEGSQLRGDGTVQNVNMADQQRPQLKIEKIAPPRAVLGQPLIYKIVVRNAGKSPAHRVVVEDRIPKGTKLTGTIPRAELIEKSLRWELGTVKPEEERVISIRVIPTEAGQIGSVAKVNFVAEVAARTIITAPKLEFTLTGPKQAVLGAPVVYKFAVKNSGQGDAQGVYIRNVLPEHLTHPDGNDLEYEVGTLKAGETREVALTLTAAKTGKLVNKAEAIAQSGVRTQASSDLEIIGKRIVITRTGPKSRYVGRVAEFTNVIKNDSDTLINGARIVEQIPKGMQFVKATAGGRFDPSTNSVTWNLPPMQGRASEKLVVELMAQATGNQSSTVTAFDPNGTKAVVESETSVIGYASVRLDVGDFRDPVDIGDQVSMRLTARNKGTMDATAVSVVLTLPAEMQLVSAKGPTNYRQTGNRLVFDPITRINVNGTMPIDLVLKALKPGEARVEMEIKSAEMTRALSRDEAVRILAPGQ